MPINSRLDGYAVSSLVAGFDPRQALIESHSAYSIGCQGEEFVRHGRAKGENFRSSRIGEPQGESAHKIGRGPILFGAAFAVALLYVALRDFHTGIPPGTDAVSYDAFAREIL